jgi:phage repressor protein C with HTH and peptisase S24 domain
MQVTDMNAYRIKRLQELIDSPMYKGNATSFARKAGYTTGASYVGQLTRGERPITEKTIEKWEKLKASPLGWFSANFLADADESNAELAGIPRGSKPTPVIGEAIMGESGYFERWDCHDGYVDGYSSTDPDAYALRVKGDSMQPAIRHGSFVVVEPNRRCVVGEYVAMALITGERMVKELVIERPNEVVIESVNGNKRRTIDRSQIETMHPVAAVVAASKWRA